MLSDRFSTKNSEKRNHYKTTLHDMPEGRREIPPLRQGVVDVHPVAIEDDGPFQCVFGCFGSGAVLFDDLGADPVGPCFQRAGDSRRRRAIGKEELRVHQVELPCASCSSGDEAASSR